MMYENEISLSNKTQKFRIQYSLLLYSIIIVYVFFLTVKIILYDNYYE